MSHTRYDIGKKSGTFQHASQKGTGHNAHDRKGPGKGFSPGHKEPVVIVPTPTPVVCIPDAPESPASVQVPDTGATAALLGLALFATVALRRFRS